MPSFWRIELAHPLLVHFPIGLLIVGSILALSSLLIPKLSRLLEDTTYVILPLGLLTGLAAYFSGNWAEEEVNATLCDPETTHFHGDLALYTLLVFLPGVVLWMWSGLRLRRMADSTQRTWLTIAALFLLLTGSGLMTYTGHLGASLVYQQGAGVFKPSESCKEFEAH